MEWIVEPDIALISPDLKLALEMLFCSQMDGQNTSGCSCCETTDYFCRACRGYNCHSIKCAKAQLLMKYFKHYFDSNKKPKKVYFNNFTEWNKYTNG